jgi:uncharacterized protein
MKMHLETGEGLNVIRAYKAGEIMINQAVYTSSLIITPNQIIADWAPRILDDLALPDFELLAGLAPEVALLGTGTRLRFPKPGLTRALISANIGLEVMDTQAACRTYNILMAEGRKVAAALLIAPRD